MIIIWTSYHKPSRCFHFTILLQSEVAYCISIGACADVVGRCALALISSLAPVNTRLLFYVATLFTLLMRIGTTILPPCFLFKKSKSRGILPCMDIPKGIPSTGSMRIQDTKRIGRQAAPGSKKIRTFCSPDSASLFYPYRRSNQFFGLN